MGKTTEFSLPWPEPTDAPQGPTQFESLASAVEEALQGVVPAGVVLPYAGPTAPSGFLRCDGSAVSRSTYSRLFEAIGTKYGEGDGKTTFNVPDFRGRALVGEDTAGLRLSGGKERGAAGGSETVALTKGELPAHTHSAGSLSAASAGSHSHGSGTLGTGSAGSHSHSSGSLYTNNAGNHNHAIAQHSESMVLTTPEAAYASSMRPGGSVNTSYGGEHSHSIGGSTASAGSHTHSISGNTATGGAHTHTVTGTSGSTGSGEAHENMPPYQVCNFIVRV